MRLNVLLVASLLVAGCQCGQGGFIPQDTGPWKPSIYIVYPGDMKSNIAPDVKIRFQVGVDSTDSAAKALFEKSITLVDLSKKSMVTGTYAWNHPKYGGYSELMLTPAAPLKEGEYQLTIPESNQYGTGSNRTARFRVGSLPIVYQVTFYLDDQKNVNIVVGFSERVQDPASNVSLQIDGKQVAPTSAKLVLPGSSFTMSLAETSLSKTYRLKVSAATKAVTGVSLDGKQSGIKTAGGSDFVLETVPATLPKPGWWQASKTNP